MNETATNEWYPVLNNQDFKTSFGLILNDLIIHVLELPICFWSSA